MSCFILQLILQSSFSTYYNSYYTHAQKLPCSMFAASQLRKNYNCIVVKYVWGQSRKSRLQDSERNQTLVGKQRGCFVTVPCSTETCSLGQAVSCVWLEMWAKVFLLCLLLGKFDIAVKAFVFCGGLAFSGRSQCTKCTMRLFVLFLLFHQCIK